MGRESRPSDSGPTLRSVEHHQFSIGGRCLLFDVNALTVVASSPLDGTILELAAGGATPAKLVAEHVSTGADPEEVVERVSALIRQGFLLPAGQDPSLAPVGTPSSYATFMVNVSQRCNLTCPYCYVNQGRFDYQSMPIARMDASTADGLVNRVHAAFPDFGTYAYHFYGGEPLMNFDAIRRVVRAAEAKARQTDTSTDYHITTNGTLLGPEVAEFMDEYRFTVYVSIEGDQPQHDEYRRFADGRGSYGIVRRNLAHLRTKPGVHVIGSSVIRRGLPLAAAIRSLEDHGANQCKAERVRLPATHELHLQGAEHDAYVEDIRGLVEHYVGHLASGRKPTDLRLSSKILQLLTGRRRAFFCPAGERMLGISADGELYPCALHVGRPQSKLGDLATGVEPTKARAFRHRFGPQGQEACRTCWTRHLCGGGCSAMVDRFGQDDCTSLRAESEAAIAVFHHFAEGEKARLYGLVSPKLVWWIEGELDDPEELMPSEPAAARVRIA